MSEITAGAFSDATLYSPRNKEKYANLAMRLKGNLETQKYGGFSREQFAYFFIYEKQDKKGRRLFCFESLSVSRADEVQRYGVAALERFAKNLLAPGETFIRIVRPALYKNQLVEIDGSRVLLRGAAEVRNATEMAFGLSEARLLADIADGKTLSKKDLLRLYDRYTDKIQRYAHELDE